MLVCARVTRISRRLAHASRRLCGAVNTFLNISLSLSLFVSFSQTTHTSIFENKNGSIVNLNDGRFLTSTSHPIHPPWSKTPVVPFNRPAGAVFRDTACRGVAKTARCRIIRLCHRICPKNRLKALVFEGAGAFRIAFTLSGSIAIPSWLTM